MPRHRLQPDDDRASQQPAWRRYIRFWGSRVDADVDDELHFHTEMRIRDYVARGMSERDARTAAASRLGNVRQVRDACLTIGHRRERRMSRSQLIDAFAQDLRYALRTLNRQRAWAAVAIATLALGIGASTAVFSVLNSIILHPLPYANANRVVMVWRIDPKSSVMMSPVAKMRDAWRTAAHSIESMELFQTGDMTLTGRGDATTIHAAAVSAGFVPFTGMRMALGRPFVAEEARGGNGHAVMISERLWRQRFGGSSDVIGARLTLDDRPFTVVGVVPNNFRLPSLQDAQTDAWLALGNDSLGVGGLVIARLTPGVTADAAARELDAIVTQNGLKERFGSKQFTVRLVKAGDLVGFKSSLFLLSAAVGLLLLVACANVAHLLLARGATRERELAIRTALGAGRRRLARQLLTESFVLAGAGCIAGIALGYAGVRVLLALRPASLKELSIAELDAHALAVALLISLLTGVAFGLTAALHAVKRTTSDSLRSTTLAGTGAKQSHRLRSFLVVTEMALSAVLLVGAALLVRSVLKLERVDSGFDTKGLYTMRVELPASRYPQPASRAAFLDEVIDRARRISGVTAVTAAQGGPPDIGGYMMAQLQADGIPANSAPSMFAFNKVQPEYFRLVGLRLLHGGTFTPGSAERGDVVINEGLAKKLWPGEAAVGKIIKLPNFSSKKRSGDDDAGLRVIGVAANTPVRGLSKDRDEPVVYYPLDRDVDSPVAVIVRASDGTDPTAMLRSIVTTVDQRLAPPSVRTVDAALAETISTQRFTMTLLAIFAVLAVLLSAVGLYGVISYVVTQRTREIGIRIALGATPRNVAHTIVLRGLLLSVAGLGVGLVVAVWGTKLIRSTLYGVSGTDPMSYGATAVVLIGISIFACLIPMRRAMRVDPVIAMRGD